MHALVYYVIDALTCIPQIFTLLCVSLHFNVSLMYFGIRSLFDGIVKII